MLRTAKDRAKVRSHRSVARHLDGAVVVSDFVDPAMDMFGRSVRSFLDEQPVVGDGVKVEQPNAITAAATTKNRKKGRVDVGTKSTKKNLTADLFNQASASVSVLRSVTSAGV